ncbi:hypothetical protein ACTFIW_002163 [Dictyostelium discoideum]
MIDEKKFNDIGINNNNNNNNINNTNHNENSNNDINNSIIINDLNNSISKSNDTILKPNNDLMNKSLDNSINNNSININNLNNNNNNLKNNNNNNNLNNNIEPIIDINKISIYNLYKEQYKRVELKVHGSVREYFQKNRSRVPREISNLISQGDYNRFIKSLNRLHDPTTHNIVLIIVLVILIASPGVTFGLSYVYPLGSFVIFCIIWVGFCAILFFLLLSDSRRMRIYKKIEKEIKIFNDQLYNNKIPLRFYLVYSDEKYFPGNDNITIEIFYSNIFHRFIDNVIISSNV